jgi:uncharacterized protein YbjT (DUF2867 family)
MTEASPSIEWVRADLLHDELDAAVRGVDAIIHLASSKSSSDADAVVAGRLLGAARTAGVRHFVAISIIGCDRIPVAALFGSEPALAAWARLVLEGYRDAWNTPRRERTLGRVRFIDWLRR